MKPTKNREVEKKKVIPYSIGICRASACIQKGLSKDEMEREMNRISPTGIGSQWVISKDKTFAQDKAPMPNQCEKEKDRLHYLFDC